MGYGILEFILRYELNLFWDMGYFGRFILGYGILPTPPPPPPLTKPLISIIYIFFFNSVLRPFQDYFSSYETSQSVGGAKTGEPREKPPDTPASSKTFCVQTV